MKTFSQFNEDRESNALHRAHMKEIEKQGAEPHNYAWAETDSGVSSKTSRGILSTERIKGKGGKVKYVHDWDD